MLSPIRYFYAVDNREFESSEGYRLIVSEHFEERLNQRLISSDIPFLILKVFCEEEYFLECEVNKRFTIYAAEEDLAMVFHFGGFEKDGTVIIYAITCYNKVEQISLRKGSTPFKAHMRTNGEIMLESDNPKNTIYKAV